MRGFDQRGDGLFSYVRPESRIPKDHPLRLIRCVADEALSALDAKFAPLYSDNGRPSIPPEQLLRALLLQAFYSIRSERQLMEQLNYNLLFRWFVGLSACRLVGGRSGVGGDGVQQEPRPVAGRRYCRGVHGRGADPAAGQGLAVG